MCRRMRAVPSGARQHEAAVRAEARRGHRAAAEERANRRAVPRQTRTVPSSEPVSTRDPSGLNEARRTGPRLGRISPLTGPDQGLPEHILDLDRPLAARRLERQGEAALRVDLELRHRLGGQLARLVRAGLGPRLAALGQREHGDADHHREGDPRRPRRPPAGADDDARPLPADARAPVVNRVSRATRARVARALVEDLVPGAVGAAVRDRADDAVVAQLSKTETTEGCGAPA